MSECNIIVTLRYIRTVSDQSSSSPEHFLFGSDFYPIYSTVLVISQCIGPISGVAYASTFYILFIKASIASTHNFVSLIWEKIARNFHMNVS